MTPLRQRMLEDMSIRNFAETRSCATCSSFAFARHSGRSPEDLGPNRFAPTKPIW